MSFSSNNFSPPCFHTYCFPFALRPESKSALFSLKQKGPAAQPAIVSGEGALTGSSTPRAARTSILPLLHRQKLASPPQNQPLPARAEGTQSETGREGGSTPQPSLPHKPRRAHRARKARGPHAEWVCWVARSDRIKVTQVHGDPAG